VDIEISPEEVFSLAAAVAIIPIIVAHIKPALRRIWPDEGPWELIADLVGVLWVLGIWQAGFAPEWIENPWAAVLAGIAVGVASSRARDAVQAVTGARSFPDAPAEPVDDLDAVDLMQTFVPRESQSVIKPDAAVAAGGGT